LLCSGNAYAAGLSTLDPPGPVISWDSLRSVEIWGSRGQFADSLALADCHTPSV